MGKVIKTRNAGTMTESQFWTWIRYMLRKKSINWRPKKLVKDAARRPYTGDNKRLKWEYQCNDCKDWFPGTEVEVDHVLEAGSLTKAEDLPGFVERLFCEKDGLQVLCNVCHDKKTFKRQTA